MCYCQQRNEFNCLVLTLDVEKLEGVFLKNCFMSLQRCSNDVQF